MPEHPRRRDVEARVEVLRRTASGDGEPEPGPAPAEPADAPPDAPSGSGGGPDGLTLGGSIALMALGAAGVVAGVVGIAGAGGCLEEIGGACVEERQIGWAGVAVWGGLGVAAIAAGVIWLVVGLSGGDGDAAVSLGPQGELKWTF